MARRNNVAQSNAIQSMVEQTPVIEPVKCDDETIKSMRALAAQAVTGAEPTLADYARIIYTAFKAQNIGHWFVKKDKASNHEAVRKEYTAFCELLPDKNKQGILLTSSERGAYRATYWNRICNHAMAYAIELGHYTPESRGATAKLPFTDSIIKDFRAIETRLQSDKNKETITEAHIDVITKYIRPAIEALKKIG